MASQHPDPSLLLQPVSSQSSTRRPSTVDPSEHYALSIRAHSQRSKDQSLFPGINFRGLAQFLERASKNTPPQSKFPSLTVHTLSPNRHKGLPTNHTIVPNSRDLAGQICQPLPDSGHVLFLHGYPSSQWINTLGAAFRVDPEFFRRHLDFLQPQTFHDLPPIPSTCRNIVRLRMTDIFRRHTYIDRKRLEALRLGETDSVERYLRELNAGDTIVRRYSVHDEWLFTVEHSLSICVKGTTQKGWTALLCCDVGKDLSQCSAAPWLNEQHHASCKPVIQHRPKVALDKVDIPSQTRPSTTSASNDLIQSASLLGSHYGSSLVVDAARVDVLYALSEIFTFAANSEGHFLNMLETLINREIRQTGQAMYQSLGHLGHSKALLEEHITSLEETCRCIENRGDEKWPKVSIDSPHSALILETHKTLLQDYNYVLDKARRLAARCIEGTDLIVNNAMLEESRKAIYQGEQVKRLTLLAFFFLPLSFTTSFFGMNVKEFGTGDRSIWIAIVVSLVVFVVSTVLCLYPGSKHGDSPERSTLKRKKQSV